MQIIVNDNWYLAQRLWENLIHIFSNSFILNVCQRRSIEWQNLLFLRLQSTTHLGKFQNPFSLHEQHIQNYCSKLIKEYKWKNHRMNAEIMMTDIHLHKLVCVQSLRSSWYSYTSSLLFKNHYQHLLLLIYSTHLWNKLSTSSTSVNFPSSHPPVTTELM